MTQILSRRFATWIVIGAMSIGSTLSASADIISTQAAIEQAQRQATVDRVRGMFARGDVSAMLVAHGVDPGAAADRVAALSDRELALVAAKMDQLPAGGTGVIEVVGIVVIVLIVLELLGVTDVFTAI